MFKASEIVINAFIARLREAHGFAWGARNPDHADLICDVARSALSQQARTNALYHDIDHTMIVTAVALEIVQGRMIREGDVTPSDWLHYIAGALSFAIGYVRGVCPGDTADACVIDEAGTLRAMPRGATDGWLWPYSTDRSKLYVRHRYRGHDVLDGNVLATNIEYTRFPPSNQVNLETTNYPGLLRAAHFIGAVADPNFMVKLKPLYLELQEAGITNQLGYTSVADLRAGYPPLYWNILHPFARDGAEYLKYTANGRQWLANMHAQLLAEEHQEPSMGVRRA